MSFPAVFNVSSDLTSSNGFKLTSTSDRFEESVSHGGDINGSCCRGFVLNSGRFS